MAGRRTRGMPRTPPTPRPGAGACRRARGPAAATAGYALGLSPAVNVKLGGWLGLGDLSGVSAAARFGGVSFGKPIAGAVMLDGMLAAGAGQRLPRQVVIKVGRRAA